MNKYYGSCNCGEISFSINKEDIKRIINCHCKLCRNMNGAAFSTYIIVLDSGYKLHVGLDKLQSHKVSVNATKSFCVTCGTPIYNTNPKYNAIKIIHLGAINNADELKPQINVFCESKLDWLDSISTLQSFIRARS